MNINLFIYRLMTDKNRSWSVLPIKAILLLCSGIYSVFMRVHDVLYSLRLLNIYKAPKPVISIGNITLGGAGKTPLTAYMVEYFKTQGKKPIIISRGFMPKSGVVSDEVTMLHEQIPDVPVIVNSNRREAIELALGKYAVDVIICDDAFVHRPLYRDIDILLINAANPFGNNHVLPRGILREPLSAIKRADIIVMAKSDVDRESLDYAENTVKRINPKALMIHTHYQISSLSDAFKGHEIKKENIANNPVLVLSAIADPDYFAHTIRLQKFNICERRDFLDHHVYTKDDLQEIIAYCHKHKIKHIMTTHKDAVKIAHFINMFEGITVIVVNIKTVIGKNEDAFLARINTIIHL